MLAVPATEGVAGVVQVTAGVRCIVAQAKARDLIHAEGMTRLAPLALVAWFIGSTVTGNDRECQFKDYRGRVHVRTIPAASTCPSSIEVPSG